MRKMRNIAVLFVLVAMAMGAAGQAFAAPTGATVSPVIDRIMAKKELVVGTAAGMPPMNMTTKDGQIVGMEVDLARVFAAAMEVKLTLKPMPFNELLPALEAGKIDMVLSEMTMTPIRNLKVAFVARTSTRENRSSEEGERGFDGTISQLNNPDKTLVALKGSTSQRFVEKLMPQAKLLLADDYNQAVVMVRNDKATAMVADFPICILSVVRFPEADLVTLDKPLTYEPIGVALHPSDQLLVNWVQNVINTLQKGGEMQMLIQRWFKIGLDQAATVRAFAVARGRGHEFRLPETVREGSI